MSALQRLVWARVQDKRGHSQSLKPDLLKARIHGQVNAVEARVRLWEGVRTGRCYNLHGELLWSLRPLVVGKQERDGGGEDQSNSTSSLSHKEKHRN